MNFFFFFVVSWQNLHFPDCLSKFLVFLCKIHNFLSGRPMKIGTFKAKLKNRIEDPALHFFFVFLGVCDVCSLYYRHIRKKYIPGDQKIT